MLLGNRARKASERYRRLFSQAVRDFQARVRSIKHAQAARGALKSGATIKAIVRASSDATRNAIEEALRGVGSITDHNGRLRARMLDSLTDELAIHHQAIRDEAEREIAQVGLASDIQHAAPLFGAERERHCELISDYREGWTAPAARPWKDRNPVTFAVLLAIISFAIGWVGKSVVGESWAAKTPPAQVAKQASENVKSDLPRRAN